MAKGTVKWFNDRKGFGFIQPDDGSKDVFAHISALERAGLRSLKEGQKISSEIETDKKTGKRSAGNLLLMSEIQSSNPKRRTVIIEDDADFAARLSSLLASLGHDVVLRLDSRASVTYEIRDSDIVFLDLLMPHVSGPQVLERLERQNTKSPIVLMSSSEHVLRETEEKFKKLHLWLLGTLYKPFNLVDVKAVLEGIP